MTNKIVLSQVRISERRIAEILTFMGPSPLSASTVFFRNRMSVRLSEGDRLRSLNMSAREAGTLLILPPRQIKLQQKGVTHNCS